MEKLERNEHLELSQSNAITRAKYSFTALEKNIMYVIIDEIQQRQIKGELQQDLFQDLIITISKERLLKIGKRMPEIERAFQTLRSKTIYITNGETHFDKAEFLITGFINDAWKPRGSSKMEVTISKRILPAYIDLAEKYTSYDAIIALSLTSVWAKRFYEIGASWKEKGYFTMSIAEIREKFVLEDKYTKYSSFKSKVIDTAFKQIKDSYDKNRRDDDFYLSYEEIKQKSKRGRPSVTGYLFKVHKRNDKVAHHLSDEDVAYNTKTLLNGLFPTNPKLVKNILTWSWENRSNDKNRHLYKRLLEKRQKAMALRGENGAIENLPAVVYTMLKNDFDFPFDL